VKDRTVSYWSLVKSAQRSGLSILHVGPITCRIPTVFRLLTRQSTASDNNLPKVWGGPGGGVFALLRFRLVGTVVWPACNAVRELVLFIGLYIGCTSVEDESQFAQSIIRISPHIHPLFPGMDRSPIKDVTPYQTNARRRSGTITIH
jgi:hypothetical protein